MERRIADETAEEVLPRRRGNRHENTGSRFGALVWRCFVRGAATAAGGAVISLLVFWIENRG